MVVGKANQVNHKNIVKTLEEVKITWLILIPLIGVKPIEDLSAGILMPVPGEIIAPLTPSKIPKTTKIKNLFTVNRIKNLQIHGIDENMACVECEGFLTAPEHFAYAFCNLVYNISFLIF